MAYAIGVFDYVPGRRREFVSTIDFQEKFTTVRDLIQRRIAEEAERLMAEQMKDRPASLVMPDWSEDMLNGPRQKRVRPIDVTRQVAIALDAFEKNAFLVIINEKQAASLDERIAAGPNAAATFIKLVPLVGG
ncbi:MAG: hypothetical protein AB7F76_10825 [Parvibaculaceae bacterium]